MDYLHWQFEAGPDSVIRVDLDTQANVMLLDESNYHSYRRGASFHYSGGLAKRSPCRLVPPHRGHWHVVIDLGGYGGTVRANVSVI